MNPSRLLLVLVIACFCLPLFVGLDRTDLDTDEAIYSFAVDRILEVGEWLQPKNSPHETGVFLEKPPLKFWIVAAPIRAGLLPHDEFGLRFWDALFGGAAFLYVFGIGCLLAGPVCGSVAVLLLFVHQPLVFVHGLRGNNMVSPLVLAYCGGIFHFLRWRSDAGRGPPAARRGHALLVGVYFVLGFMTKFVAALFLPLVIAAAALISRPLRHRMLADWRLWAAAAGLALVLILPWFVYAQITFGPLVWQTMLAEHVYKRFTVSLDSSHIETWSFYPRTMYQTFAATGSAWLVGAGLVVLGMQTVARRWLEGAVVLLWAILPVTLMSLGRSKLYHYAYPFLPPLALAAGYVVALVVLLAPVPIRKAFEAVEDSIARLAPGLSRAASRPGVRPIAWTIVWAAVALGVAAALDIPVRLAIGRSVLFRNSGIVRPCLVILVAALLTRASVQVARPLVVILALVALPVAPYWAALAKLAEVRHPLRSSADCIRVIETRAAGGPPGLYVDTDTSMWHPIYYYYRHVRPWVRPAAPSAAALHRYLNDRAVQRPVLVSEQRYHEYVTGPEASLFNRGESPNILHMPDYALLLPGPYAACDPQARR